MTDRGGVGRDSSGGARVTWGLNVNFPTDGTKSQKKKRRRERRAWTGAAGGAAGEAAARAAAGAAAGGGGIESGSSAVGSSATSKVQEPDGRHYSGSFRFSRSSRWF